MGERVHCFSFLNARPELHVEALCALGSVLGELRVEVLAEADPLGLPSLSSALDMKQSSCVAFVSVTFADTYKSRDVKTTFKRLAEHGAKTCPLNILAFLHLETNPKYSAFNLHTFCLNRVQATCLS